MQDFSTRIGLVASLHQVTSYSSGVNEKTNQAKLKENPRLYRSEEALCHDEKVRHEEGCVRYGEEEVR